MDGWSTVLQDAGLIEDGEFADALAATHAAADSEDPALIRASTQRLARAAEHLIEDLRLIEAFQPSIDGRTRRAEGVIRQIATDAIDAVVAREASRQEQLHEALSELIASMAHAPKVVDDRLAAVFGATHTELADGQGRTSVDRIVASLHRQGRLGDDLIGPILAPITASPPPGVIGVRAALSHLISPRPLKTLRSAVQVQELILNRVALDVTDTGSVLRTLKLGVERSAASHRGIMRVEAELANVTAPSDIAYLTLDLYRRVMESQVRPWGWALLRLAGATARETPPELGTMRQQLGAAPESLLNAWAEPILPAARNAAAHEDYMWDHDAGALRAGSDLVTAAELEASVVHGYSLMIGAESGWACARANSRALARELDADDPPGGSRTLNLWAALSRFGTNGLHVRTATWEGAVVVVELDGLSEQDINPCFQAVIESVEWVTPERYEIRLPGRSEPIMRLTEGTVRASRELWVEALQRFRDMPTSVFVPLNLEARLEVEGLETANRAVAWLTLDDAVMAHEEHDWWIPEQALRVARRLHLARQANEVIRSRMPTVSGDPFRAATELIRTAEASARATAIGLALPDPADPVRRLQAAFDALERPLILPTLGT